MKIKFVKQDCWIGFYWKNERKFVKRLPPETGHYGAMFTTWYLCIIPCFPIIWETREWGEHGL